MKSVATALHAASSHVPGHATVPVPETAIQTELEQAVLNDHMGKSVKGTQDVQEHQHCHISSGLRIFKGSHYFGDVSCAAMAPEANLLLRKVLQFGRYPLHPS
ncbi:hypothetical protein MTO96_040129 [Rhipicephalus appendiculatus]